jgi:hypothetical protein
MTVKRKLEQVFETAQAQAEAREEDDEHSEEWLNIFSQEAEKTAIGEVAEAGEEEVLALDLAANEAEEKAGRSITPWEMELEMLEDWLNNPEPARELAEFELSGKVDEQQVSERETT